MVYLINHLVLFSTLEYQLSLLDDDTQIIQLSNTSGRVLDELLIAHGNGETVTRETLFARVWEQHGLQSSNGNLNQQISLIRKALISLGLDSTAIVTLPKRGFKINDRLIITPHPPTEKPSAPPQEIESAPEMNPAPAITPFSHPPGSLRFVNLLLAIAVVITLLMTYSYFRVNEKQPLFFFRKIDACNVYTLRPINEREHADFAARIPNAMAGNIDQCTDRDVVLFSRTTQVNPQIKQQINRRTFLAKCEKDARGQLTDCLNFYFYNWEDQ